MVISKIRKKLVIFIWAAIIIFVLFIFLQWGMDVASSKGSNAKNLNIVGRVNGIGISYTEFEKNYSQTLQQLRKQYGELSPEQKKVVSDRIFNQMVADVLMNEEINKLHFDVSDKEIMNIILNSPPQNVMNDTSLFTNGKFDINKYRAIIQDPRNSQYVNMYAAQLKEVIPKQKLQDYITSFIALPDNEIIRNIVENYQKETIEYGVFPIANDMQNVNYTESQGKEYYETHKNQFIIKNKADIAVVRFPIEPSITDQDLAYSEIKEIYNEVKSGKDFAEEAKTISQDPGSATNGGMLGWIKKGMMVPQFEKVAFSMKSGEISTPFKTKYGWHIVKVYSNRGDSVKVAHILIKLLPSDETIYNIKENADNFTKIADKIGIEKAAENAKLSIDTFKLVDMDNPVIEEYGETRELKQFLKNHKSGDISYAVNTGKYFIVASIIAKYDSTLLPFDKVKDVVKDSTMFATAQIITRGRAAGAYKLIQKGKSFKGAVEDRKGKYYKMSDITMFSNIPGIGNELKFNGAAFSLKEGLISKPFKVGDKYTILRVINKKDISQDELKKILTNFVSKLKSMKQQEVFNDWLKELIDKSKIEDYRYQFGY
ncbi:peptidylprolyl isomerase [candidate division WOR-3 bacterium]|nr:peptidylprolyl isomerase [candidate division WOR-3 bacterium]